ncbi:MAG: sigma-70 family RNA polymerase sigma factor [Saprospiraceae bacterium]|nr:sigma-70 family RNA polymerase sigma factor [Saprospiraceae bacterium]
MNPILIKQCIAGNRSAQKELYESYKVTLFVLCQRYFNNIEDANDVLQEGFVKVFRDLHQYDDNKGHLISWIKKVFINTCLEKIRKKKLLFNQISESHYEVPNDADIISDLHLKDITKMIQSLPLGYRTVFNLYVIEGFNHQEIGQQLGISESTSKTQLMKAKNMLKGKLETILK